MANRASRTADENSYLNLRTLLIVMALAVAVFLAFRLLSPGQETEGREAFASGDYESAAEIFGRLVESDEGDNESRYYYAVAQRHRRLVPDAVQNLTVLRASDRWQEQAFYQLVRTFIEADRFEDAANEFRQADDELKKSPLFHEAEGLFRLSEGQRIREQVIKRIEDTAGPRTALRNAGRVGAALYADNRNYRTLLESLLQRLEGDSNFADSSGFESLVDRGHREFQGAERAFRAAIAAAESDSEPAVPRSHFELATYHEFRKDAESAERHRRAVLTLKDERLNDDLDRLSELQTLRERSLEYLAENLIDVDRPQDAIDAILELEPKTEGKKRAFAYDRLLAFAYDKLGQEDQVLTIVNRWLKKNEGLSDMNFLRGKYHYGRKEYTDAQIYLEKGLSKNPSMREYAAMLADTYMKLGIYDRANNLWKSLVEFRPNNWEFQLQRVKAMEGMGWFAEARGELAGMLSTRFNAPGTPAHTALRNYMQELLTKYDFLPTSLHQARKLFDEDPGNYLAGTRYLEFLVDADNFGRAEALAKTLKTSIPPEAPERFELAMACGTLGLDRGDFDEAAHCFEDAANRRPHEVDVFVGSARAAIGRNRLGRAWEELEKVRALAPEHPAIPRLEFRINSAIGDHARTISAARQLAKTDDFTLADARLAFNAAVNVDDKAARNAFLQHARRLAGDAVEDQLIVADLLESSGQAARARGIRVKLVEANPNDMKTALTVGQGLFEAKEYRRVVSTLEPVIALNPLATSAHLSLVVSSWEALADDGKFIEALGDLLKIDRPRAWEFAAEFCADRGAFREVRSIIVAARRVDALTPRLIRAGARAALVEDDPGEARRLESELKRNLSATSVDFALLRAQLLNAEGDIAGAESVLENARDAASDEDRSRLLELEIEIFGRRQQSQLMIETLLEGFEGGYDVQAAAESATRYAFANLMDGAPELVDDAIERFGPTPALSFILGLSQAVDRDWRKAEQSLMTAYNGRPTAMRGRALSVVFGVNGSRGRLTRLEADVDGDPALDPRAGKTARFIEALVNHTTEKTLAQAELMRFETGGERRSFIGFLSRSLANAEHARILKDELPVFFLMKGLPFGQARARQSINRLRDVLEDETAAIKLLEARLLMSHRETYHDGITIVARLLEASGMKDEAALQIYLESYLASGDMDAVKQLVDVILQVKDLPTTARRETASVLLEAGEGEQAARILNADMEASPERVLLEARAQYGAGNLSRAATIVDKSEDEVRRHPLAMQILAERALGNRKTAGQGWEFARLAAQLAADEHPTLYLTLAHAGFMNGRTGEAWQALDRYLETDFCSGRHIAKAIKLINDLGIKDAAQRDRLYRRQILIDPEAFGAKGL